MVIFWFSSRFSWVFVSVSNDEGEWVSLGWSLSLLATATEPRGSSSSQSILPIWCKYFGCVTCLAARASSPQHSKRPPASSSPRPTNTRARTAGGPGYRDCKSLSNRRIRAWGISYLHVSSFVYAIIIKCQALHARDFGLIHSSGEGEAATAYHSIHINILC